MEVAARSYLTAGIAAVGATALIASPIAPTPPDITVRADDLSAVFSDYTPTALSSALLGLPSAAAIRDAIGNLTLGGLGAFNIGLAGAADVAGIGATAFSDIASSMALTGQTMNTALVAGFLAAIGFEIPAGQNASAAATTLVSTADIRDAIGNLTLGFLTAVNAGLGGLADVADIGAVAFSDIAASLALTGQTVATALTAGFLAAIGFEMPAEGGAATAAAARTMVSTNDLRDAVGNLTMGFLTAVNATLGGLADVADIGAVAFSDAVTSLAVTGQTAATALTNGFLAAIGFQLPHSATTAAAAMVSPGGIRDAVGNLTLGFLGAFNAGLGGLADVADIGAVAFSDIAASLALTGQTAATALTAGFLAAIGFQVPTEEQTSRLAAAAMVSPSGIRDAVGNLTLGGLAAFNAGLAGLADVADIGAVAFSDIAASLALTGQTAATALTAGFLNAIGFQPPVSQATATAAALVGPGSIRDAVGNLTLGGLAAFNASLAGLADVADIGAVAFSDIAASLALTGQTAATALTAGFLTAIGFQVPQPKAPESVGPASLPQAKTLVNVSVPKAEVAKDDVVDVKQVATEVAVESTGAVKEVTVKDADGAVKVVNEGSVKVTDGGTETTTVTVKDDTVKEVKETESGGGAQTPGSGTDNSSSTGSGSTGSGSTDAGTGTGGATGGDDATPAPTKRAERKQLRNQQSQDRKTTRQEQKADRADNQQSTRAERTTERKAQAVERNQQRQADKQERKTQRQQHNGSGNGGSNSGSSE
ncbi:hypothetical protein [Mycobacterium sp. NPDC004974]